MAEFSRRDALSLIFLIVAAIIAGIAIFSTRQLENHVDLLLERQAELSEENQLLQDRKDVLESTNEKLQGANELLVSERDSLQEKVESGQYEISLATKSQADMLRAILGEQEFREWTRLAECGESESETYCRFYKEYGELLDLRQESLIKRSAAQSRADFRELHGIYQAIHSKNERMKDREVWSEGRADYSRSYRTFAQEGLAYSLFRLDEIGDAEQLIRAALSGAPGSATVNLTYLKIMCKKRVNPADVQDAMSTARTALDRRIGRTSRDTLKRIARINRAHLEQDLEMREQCAYADISYT